MAAAAKPNNFTWRSACDSPFAVHVESPVEPGVAHAATGLTAAEPAGGSPGCRSVLKVRFGAGPPASLVQYNNVPGTAVSSGGAGAGAGATGAGFSGGTGDDDALATLVQRASQHVQATVEACRWSPTLQRLCRPAIRLEGGVDGRRPRKRKTKRGEEPTVPPLMSPLDVLQAMGQLNRGAVRVSAVVG